MQTTLLIRGFDISFCCTSTQRSAKWDGTVSCIPRESAFEMKAINDRMAIRPPPHPRTHAHAYTHRPLPHPVILRPARHIFICQKVKRLRRDLTFKSLVHTFLRSTRQLQERWEEAKEESFCVCAVGLKKKKNISEAGWMIEGWNPERTPGGVQGRTKSQIELRCISAHVACIQIVSNVFPP